MIVCMYVYALVSASCPRMPEEELELETAVGHHVGAGVTRGSDDRGSRGSTMWVFPLPVVLPKTMVVSVAQKHGPGLQC